MSTYVLIEGTSGTVDKYRRIAAKISKPWLMEIGFAMMKKFLGKWIPPYIYISLLLSYLQRHYIAIIDILPSNEQGWDMLHAAHKRDPQSTSVTSWERFSQGKRYWQLQRQQCPPAKNLALYDRWLCLDSKTSFWTHSCRFGTVQTIYLRIVAKWRVLMSQEV